jgi:hypothetical protein
MIRFPKELQNPGKSIIKHSELSHHISNITEMIKQPFKNKVVEIEPGCNQSLIETLIGKMYDNISEKVRVSYTIR